MKKALQGLKVVDLTQHLAGPFCTMLLADMGAEVIKIEPPWGDATRSSPQYPEVQGQNTYFMFVNRNKKSLVLNLKSEKGIEILKKLVKKSDILVENFRPGVMDRLGVGYEVIKEVNPRLIYASISGFGHEGPYTKRPSFDIVAQAMSGWMWLNSRETRGLNSGPSLIPSTLAGSPGDTIPGTFCAMSILAALHYRTETGHGQRIDVPQMDSLMTISGLALTRYLFTGLKAEEKAKQERTMIHGVYEAKDGFVVLRAFNESSMNFLADKIGVDIKIIGPTSEILINWLKERTREEILGLLAENIPCASVVTEEELVMDPSVIDHEMVIENLHPMGFKYRAVATGIRFSETPVSFYRHPPMLGENSKEVLFELGYSDLEITNLIKEKVTALNDS